MKQLICLLASIGFLLAGEATAIYKVEGMMCNKNCPMKVNQSLEGVNGVKTCNVDFDSKTATVTYDDDKIDSKKISDIIARGTYYKVTDAKKKSLSLISWLFGKS